MQHQEYERPSNPLGALMYDLHVAVLRGDEPPPASQELRWAPTGRPNGEIQRARKAIVLSAVADLENRGQPPTTREVYAHIRSKAYGWGDRPERSVRNVLDCAANAGDIVRYMTPSEKKRDGSGGERMHVRFGIPK